MAKFNLEFYKNEVEYSDGYAIEEEILDIVQSKEKVNLNEIENATWPIFYHLSPLRENILNWYPFKENSNILEVGSGCGAITGLLCERADYVASVELTQRRATINYERHKEYDNLEIFVGNLDNIHFKQKFDYVVVNGVLEYAGGFISGDRPYQDFMILLSNFLKEDGTILIAIENRLGLKYFSGAKEDHTGKLFDGLNGYSNGEQVRTFSKKEITSLIEEESNLVVKKFYYPYPDYKFPEIVYSDRGFDKVPISYDVYSYDYDRYMFFDELQMQNLLAKEEVRGAFANSFLVEVCKNTNVNQNTEDILYVKINANRDDAFKICTVIFDKDNELMVRKKALTKQAINHLQQMHRFFKEQNTSQNGATLLPSTKDGNDLLFQYVELPTIEDILLDYERHQNKNDLFSLLQNFFNMLKSYQPIEMDAYSEEFHLIFGNEKYKDELEFTSFNNIDVLFDNIFFSNNKLIIFDYEWCLDCKLPIKFIFWRAIKEFYGRHHSFSAFVSDKEVYTRFNISDEMIGLFFAWEGYFSANYVKMFNKSKYQKETISLTNIEDAFNRNIHVANLYVNTGNGFNDKEKCQLTYEIDSQPIVLNFDISQFKNIEAIRFDPIEGYLCKCNLISVEIDGENHKFVAYNNFPFTKDKDIFLTTDPIYMLQKGSESGDSLSIYFSIELLKQGQIYEEIIQGIESELLGRSEYEDVMSNKLLEAIKETESLNNEKNALLREYDELLLEKEELLTEIEHISQEFNLLTSEREKLTEQLSKTLVETENLVAELDNLTKEHGALLNNNELLLTERDGLAEQLASLAKEYNTIYYSNIWRMTKPIRFLLDTFKKSLRKIKTIIKESYKLLQKTKRNISNYGLKKTIKKIKEKGFDSINNIKKSSEIVESVQASDSWSIIEKWIDETPHTFIDIFHVPMGWDTPLFQRFQHLSLQAGNVGGISIYGAHPLVDKDIEVFRFISPTLCIVNLDNYEVKRKLFELLDRKTGPKIIRLQSIDLATTINELESFIERKYDIVYEYIDELTPQITGNIPDFVFDRHEYVMRNEEITVIATADKLYDQVKPYRVNNTAMITNGVDYEHWNIDKNTIKCPDDIQDIVNKGKIIIGYHGALAQWLDYEVLVKLAEDERFTLLLIGYEHDESLRKSGLLEKENVKYVGSKPYSELNQYAVFYDIAILPFLKNGVTESVSPVKIFEYMALQKPIVTYGLHECLKYESCLIADSQQEFIDLIEKSIELRFDKKYCDLLKEEALANSWTSITKQTIELVMKKRMNNGNTNDQTPLSIENPLAPQEKRMYQMMKQVFWRMPIMPKKAKGKFLFWVKKSFYPSLLSYSPTEQESNEEHSQLSISSSAIPKDQELNHKQNYIEQILKIPDQDPSKYVSITDNYYVRQSQDTKIIAYYLTQFHPDPHNEKWWGKGVTEWNNVCRAVPQFVGHYQPRLPGELGFYDLRLKENMMRQIELAQMYGVYGFSFYYYWFDGERLLEKPIEMFLADESLNFPFSLCWANENWTKRFDGTNSDILMEQPKSVSSYKNVIHDMVRFLRDKRYITIQGKKLITVYRPSLMPQPEEVLQYWREYCDQQGIGELYIIAVKENMVDLDLLGIGFDAISEFHPGTVYTNCKNITQDIDYVREDFSGEVFDYRDLVENQKYFKYQLPKLYRAVMPMWDNTARRNNKGMIFHGASPELYKQWLKDVIFEGRNRSDLDTQMVFINAWNEWGEGAYLEPDKKYGYAYLQATKDAIEELRKK